MQCEQVQPALENYVHGTVRPQERATIEAHLSTCGNCSAEVAAVKAFGQTLRQGLTEWIDQGTCPEELSRQIELHLRSVGRKSWWQTWQGYTGVSVAAAAVLMVLMWTQPGLTEHMASVPLVGAIAAQFLGPDLEVQVDPMQPIGASMLKQARTVSVNRSVEKLGNVLTVDQVETSSQLTRVRFSIQGISLDTQVDPMVYRPYLQSIDGPVKLKGFTADQRTGKVVLEAYFDPIPANTELTLTMASLPDSISLTMLSFKPGTQPTELKGANATWDRKGTKASMTVKWQDPTVVRLMGWTAQTASGKSLRVTEEGRPTPVEGGWAQTVAVESPDGTDDIMLQSTQLETLVNGPWAVSFHN